MHMEPGDQAFHRMQLAAWAAFRREPDADGIRRVRLSRRGSYRSPMFCLTEGGEWYLEDVAEDGGSPEAVTTPRPCPPDWVPPEWREAT
jgi:hypothetical protein